MPFEIFGRPFRPTVWGFALTVAFCAAFIALGNWQTRRAAERRALGASYDAALRAPAVELPAAPVRPAEYAHRRVAVRGRFVAEQTILLEFKRRRGRLGYEVVTPLRFAGTDLHVLVDRGWVAARPEPGQLPEIRTPAGELRLEGIALARLPQALDLERGPPPGRVWPNLRIDDVRTATGLRLQPLVIEQLSDTGDGLLREWPRPDLDAARNDAYALQWYSFAAVAVVIFVALSFRRRAGG